jgi:D-3-phosphoglycerate dehydrogenase
MSDILTIHTRLSDRTIGYIDKKKINLMKKGSVIVNTSRGPIIKEQDLIDALNNDVISCAALDVYDQEPLPKDHILRKTKNLILTPHIGYVSEEAYEKFFNGYLKAIEGFIEKKPVNQIS